MPKSKPKNSTIVILEATRAVLYNYYGPFDKLYTAYDKMNAYMQENKLEQSAPAREFYLSDVTQERDPNRWLSKIYIPVK
jgi:effector-binding domain-containing protein